MPRCNNHTAPLGGGGWDALAPHFLPASEFSGPYKAIALIVALNIYFGDAVPDITLELVSLGLLRKEEALWTIE